MKSQYWQEVELAASHDLKVSFLDDREAKYAQHYTLMLT